MAHLFSCRTFDLNNAGSNLVADILLNLKTARSTLLLEVGLTLVLPLPIQFERLIIVDLHLIVFSSTGETESGKVALQCEGRFHRAGK